jgi:DNA-binding transcriptional LysR family regulator
MSLLNRELDYFLAICETRNLARAAETLSVSQPALTRSLQRLEAHFGAQLFVRTPRGVELTPIGTALRARVDKARITLDDAETEVEQLGAGKIGRVRIGVGHVFTRMASQALFPRFIVERPAAQVQFHVGFNAELFGLLEAGNLDFAVCGVIETPQGLVFRELQTSRLTVVVRHGHPLTRIKSPSIRDLAPYRSVAPSAGVPARKLVEAQLAKHGVGDRPHAIETNSWETILDAVASTDLFSLAPQSEILLRMGNRRLVAISIPELDIHPRNGIVTRAEAYLSPLAARAIELVELAFGDLAREQTPRPAPELQFAAR